MRKAPLRFKLREAATRGQNDGQALHSKHGTFLYQQEPAYVRELEERGNALLAEMIEEWQRRSAQTKVAFRLALHREQSTAQTLETLENDLSSHQPGFLPTWIDTPLRTLRIPLTGLTLVGEAVFNKAALDILGLPPVETWPLSLTMTILMFASGHVAGLWSRNRDFWKAALGSLSISVSLTLALATLRALFLQYLLQQQNLNLPGASAHLWALSVVGLGLVGFSVLLGHAGYSPLEEARRQHERATLQRKRLEQMLINSTTQLLADLEAQHLMCRATLQAYWGGMEKTLGALPAPDWFGRAAQLREHSFEGLWNWVKGAKKALPSEEEE